MSEKFGPDWRLMEANRVRDFQLIMMIQADLQSKQRKNASNRSNNKDASTRRRRG